MGEASYNGLSLVKAQCKATYTAMTQINLCISQGVNTLSIAKRDAMPQFSNQCADYVQKKVCVPGSKCGKDASKITPDMAATAIASYVRNNRQALLAKIQSVVRGQIQQIITANYDRKFKNRAVPNIVQAQCANELMKK